MIDRRIGKIKVRRGTNLQRKLVNFEEGEILYTIDSKRAYVGDGSTLGGNVISNLNYITTVAGLPSNVVYGDIIHVETTKNTYIVGHDLDGITLKLILIASGNFSDNLNQEIEDLFNKIKPLTGCLTAILPPEPPLPEPPLPVAFVWVIEPVDVVYSNNVVINAVFTAKARGPYDDIVYTWEKITAGSTTTTTTTEDNTLLITHENDFIVTHQNDNILIKSDTTTITSTVTDPLIENWVAIPKAIGEKLTILDAQQKDIGHYRCIATSKAGRLVSVRAKLDINSIEFKWRIQPQSYSTQIGSPAQFTAEAYNSFNEAITYQWYKDDIIISGATSRTYPILRTFKTDIGKYKCVATTTYKGTPRSITSNIADLNIGTSYILGKNPTVYIISRAGEYIKWR
jgi:hypothetical protein